MGNHVYALELEQFTPVDSLIMVQFKRNFHCLTLIIIVSLSCVKDDGD